MTIPLNLDEAREQAPVGSDFFHLWTLPDGSEWTRFYRLGSGYLLRFPGLADFWVARDGQAVTCYPVPQVTEETTRHLYLNQVLPLALGRQGKLVLHASAVELAGHAVAFLGESGRGKSTLAASFATSGRRFLTDDGLLLEPKGSGYQVLPSHPSIRLWDDSQAALISPHARLAPPVQFTAKARFLAGEDIAFCEQARPLRRVYFLGGDTVAQVVFERMNPAQALVELVKNSFLLDIEARDMLAAHFDALARLVNQPMCYRLEYPRRFEDLAMVRQAIVAHATYEDQDQ